MLSSLVLFPLVPCWHPTGNRLCSRRDEGGGTGCSMSQCMKGNIVKKFLRYNHETGKTEEFERHKANPGAARWPFVSESAGGHPSQREEIATYLSSVGVPTEVTVDGNPVMTGPQHRKKVLKALGMYDKSEYY